MLIARAALLCLTLAACQQDSSVTNAGEAVDGTPPTGNEIQNLTNPEDAAATPPPQLDPISFAEMEQAGVLGAGCSFSIGDDAMLVSGSGAAIVKNRGRIVRLSPAAPVDDRAGLFQSEALSVSVGRVEEQGRAADEVTSWPARAVVTDRRSDAESEIEGVWSCGT